MGQRCFRVGDQAVPFPERVQIILEQLPHQDRVSPGSTEQGRRFKGTGAGLHIEILGIHHQTAVQRRGFPFGEFQLVVKIPCQFRNQLAG